MAALANCVQLWSEPCVIFIAFALSQAVDSVELLRLADERDRGAALPGTRLELAPPANPGDRQIRTYGPAGCRAHRRLRPRQDELIAAIGRWALLPLLCLVAGGAISQAPDGDALRAQFATVRDQGTGKLVDRSVYLLSTESADRMQGDVFALVDLPFDKLRQVLTRAEDWCDVLILHINTQYCRVSRSAAKVEILAGVGRKYDQPLADVYWLRFDYRALSSAAAYFEVALRAPSGPLSTSDYRLFVEAAPLDQHQSLLHLRYSYAYGLAGRWAMQTYLATVAHDKVGFTVIGQRSDGQPIYVAGVRGVLERNTMRYYLGIETVLAAAKLPASSRLSQKSLQDWFGATERYPPQLHEIDSDTYVQMKLRELLRQQTEPPPATAN
jgi:hypothetical protein